MFCKSYLIVLFYLLFTAHFSLFTSVEAACTRPCASANCSYKFKVLTGNVEGSLARVPYYSTGGSQTECLKDGDNATGHSESGYLMYKFDASSTAADNGKTVIQPLGRATGRWIKKSEGLDTTNFNSILSATENDVQKALDVVDDLNTDDLPEGAKKFADDDLSDNDTDDLPEGMTNKYEAQSTTDDLPEGVTNKYSRGDATITLCSTTANANWHCDYTCASAETCQVAFATAQAEIDAMPQGGLMKLSEGDFRVSGIDFTQPRVYLLGAGMDATSITLISGSNREAINVSFASSAITNWGMSDLTIYGNKGQNSSGGCFVTSVNVRDVFLTNVFFSQCKGVGATINNIWGLNTKNLIIEWGDTDGLVLDSTVSGAVNAKISMGKIIDNAGDAIRVLGAAGVIIDGNELSGGSADKAGIYLNGMDAIIVNNKFTSVTSGGDIASNGIIIGADGDYANISNNTFLGANMVAAISYAAPGAIYNTIANNEMRIATANPIPAANRDTTTMIMQRTGTYASGNYRLRGKLDIEADSSVDLRLNPSALSNVSLFKDKTDFPEGTGGRSLDVWRNNKRVYLQYDGWGFGQLWSDEDLSIGTRDGGTIKFFNWVAGNNIFQVGSAGGTSNTALHLYGTINSTNRYVQWKVDDTDDYLNLTRSNAAVLGMKINMPLAVTVGNSDNKAVCWKSGGVLGYCSTQPDSGGSCTCN